MHTSSASLGPLVQNQVSSDGTPAQRATDAILDDALNALEQYRGDPKAESRWKVVQCIEPLLKQKAQVTVGTLDLSECKSTDIKALPPAVVKALALRVGTLLMTGTPPDWVKELDKLADLTARHWRCCW